MGERKKEGTQMTKGRLEIRGWALALMMAGELTDELNESLEQIVSEIEMEARREVTLPLAKYFGYVGRPRPDEFMTENDYANAVELNSKLHALIFASIPEVVDGTSEVDTCENLSHES